MSFVAFHYRSYGTFFYTQKSSIISMVDLPTTDIIEPLKFIDYLLLAICIRIQDMELIFLRCR
ncbi:hypothetical protein F6P71_00600 [Streptococcus suis]|nr:hypothetical protein [Streptococcus suis]